MIEIPLNTSPEQKFSITLNSVKYNIRVLYSSRAKVWHMSISDVDNVKVVTGIALLSGVDILKQYNLDIKNMFIIDMEDKGTDPSVNTLGIRHRLFMLDDSELVA